MLIAVPSMQVGTIERRFHPLASFGHLNVLTLQMTESVVKKNCDYNTFSSEYRNNSLNLTK